jgi:hypothetical protein
MATALARLAPPTGPGSPMALLAHARSVLGDAAMADTPAERFSQAHLAALRIAAALFAARGRPTGARRRLMNAWVLLEAVAPDMSDWATYFAAAAPARAAAEAGATSAVTPRDADDQLRAAEQFLALVESAIGLLAAPLAS